MRIVTRSGPSKEWKLVESADYTDEAELQKLLAESPSLIPMDEVRAGAAALVVAIREFGLPGSGSTDLLAFSADGDVALVECKLAANQEIKRKVVGQILEYASYLWQMRYEEVNERVYQRTGQRLAELVAAAVGTDDWDEEAFRSNVADALERGSFILVIAVDEINEELRRTIEFLNGCTSAAFSFNALEMRRFQEGETEMLIPHVHGGSAIVRPGPGPRPKWTRDRFLEKVRDSLSPDVAVILEDLCAWSEGQADALVWGTGRERGSFSFHYHQEGTVISVFSVLTDGELWLNLNSMAPKLPLEVLQEFHRALHEISGFAHIPADFGRWPVVRVERVFAGQPEALAAFKRAVVQLGKRVHGVR